MEENKEDITPPVPEKPETQENLSVSPTIENQPNKKTKKIFISVMATVVAVCVGLILFFLPLFTGEAHADTIIRIPRDASEATVADSVSKYLGEEYAKKLIKAAKIQGADFSNRHGAYLIPEGTSPMKAARQLAKGAQEPVTITINGFRTLGNLAVRLERRLDFTAEEFLEAATNEDLLNGYGLSPEQALSLFIDDSYQVYWSGSPEDLVNKVGSHYKDVWNEERMNKAAALNLTPAEIMTICSIVDEESNKLDEKGTIGRLYINRLQQGMKLQADPTVRYALGDFTIKRVTGKHLQVDSPYNTYRVQGLPPGPIRTTSVATIDAVLNSSPHDYLYMCAKEDFSGYHNFAVSYDEHLENARRYQKALDEMGIK